MNPVGIPKAKQGRAEKIEGDTAVPQDDTVPDEASSGLLSPAVLVVDDEAGVRNFLVEALTLRGYRVDAVSTCSQAATSISFRDYASIVLDVVLPDDSGIRFYYHLKKRWPRLARRVVFLTGAIEFSPCLGSLLAEGRPVLLKPITLSELLAVISRVH